MDTDLHRFLTAHPALCSVLDESTAPLTACFGPHHTTLAVLTDHAEGAHLRLTVHLPVGQASQAEAALARFDDTWWRANCHRTDGLLVVDWTLEDTP